MRVRDPRVAVLCKQPCLERILRRCVPNFFVYGSTGKQVCRECRAVERRPAQGDCNVVAIHVFSCTSGGCRISVSGAIHVPYFDCRDASCRAYCRAHPLSWRRRRHESVRTCAADHRRGGDAEIRLCGRGIHRRQLQCRSTCGERLPCTPAVDRYLRTIV